MAEQAAALLYNMEHSEKGKKVKFILIRMGIRIKNIQPEQYQIPLGILSGVQKLSDAPSEFTPYTGEGFAEEMLVMKNFSNAQLDEFLFRMRKDGIPRIALKAVLTPSNLSWDSLTLYEELKKEHAAMRSSASNPIHTGNPL